MDRFTVLDSSRLLVGLRPRPPLVANSHSSNHFLCRSLLLTFQRVSQIFRDGLNPSRMISFLELIEMT